MLLTFGAACASSENGGPSGSGGATGTAGTTGTAGAIGTAGTTGSAGTTGNAGTTGVAGTTGTAGTTGSARHAPRAPPISRAACASPRSTSARRTPTTRSTTTAPSLGLTPLAISPCRAAARGSRSWARPTAWSTSSTLDATDQLVPGRLRAPRLRRAGHLRRRDRRRAADQPAGDGLDRQPQLRRHQQPLRPGRQLPDGRLLLRHVHGPLRRHHRDLGDQADRHQRRRCPPTAPARPAAATSSSSGRSTRTTGASPSTAPTTPATSARRSPSRVRPASGSSTLDERRQHPPGRSHEGRERQRRAADQRLRLGLQPQRLRARRLGSDGARSSSPCARTTRRPAASRGGSRSRPARRPSIPSISTTTSRHRDDGGRRRLLDHRQRHPRRAAGERERPGRHPPAARRQHDQRRRPTRTSRWSATASTIARRTWRRTAPARCWPPGRRRRRPATSRRTRPAARCGSRSSTRRPGCRPAGSTAASAGPLKLTPNVLGSRYQDFRAYPDGSVAYPAPGSSGTKIKILRVLPCS